MSFELLPQEEHLHQGEDEGGGGGSSGGVAEGLHLLFPSSPLEGDGARSCGVSHAAVPPIHSSTHTHRVRGKLPWCLSLPDSQSQSFAHVSVSVCVQSKRDILSETKYIELVLVADHQEVNERITTRRRITNEPFQGGGCH